jgi:hypothetical protein
MKIYGKNVRLYFHTRCSNSSNFSSTFAKEYGRLLGVFCIKTKNNRFLLVENFGFLHKKCHYFYNTYQIRFLYFLKYGRNEVDLFLTYVRIKVRKFFSYFRQRIRYLQIVFCVKPKISAFVCPPIILVSLAKRAIIFENVKNKDRLFLTLVLKEVIPCFALLFQNMEDSVIMQIKQFIPKMDNRWRTSQHFAIEICKTAQEWKSRN